MINLVIGPKHEVYYAKIKYNCDYVISIQDFADDAVPLPPGIVYGNHKHFFFDDLTDAVPHRYSSRDADIVRGHPPDINDVQGILAYFKTIPDWSRVYIHCFAGVSRSTAMAFMCYCSQSPSDSEDGCMMQVERSALASAIWPNELIVRLADEELGRGGKMIKAVEAWKEAEKAMTLSENLRKAVAHSDEIKKSIGPEWEAQQQALKIDKPDDSQ